VIRAALVDAMERSETGYPPELGASGLPEACAAWLGRSFDLHVEPDQIRTLPDVLRGIELAIQLFSRSESAVVVTTPSYPPFFQVVRAAGREVVEVPMATDGGRAVFDLDAVGAALRAGAGTVILCNPYNPLGRVFRRDELAALAKAVERHGARVVADEVHAPLIYPGAKHVSYSTVSGAAARHSVTLTSASKGWNVPGLKCAQIVLTNEVDRAIWDRLPAVRTRGASVLGIVANRVAYEQGGPWLAEVVRYLDGNRSLLAELLARHLPQVRYTVPEGTYLAWLDCRDLGLDDPAAFCLERAKVGLSAGPTFGPPGAGHVRLNFATSRAILTEIVERMATAMSAG
jgi:cystathionine beta-lyase